MNRLLPRTLDDDYRGHPLGLWSLGILVILKTLMSMNSIFNGDMVASSADGIPLAAYPEEAAATIVGLFALLGVARLPMLLLSVVALVRYRAAVPMLFVLFLLEHLCRTAVLRLLPIVRVGAPPASLVNAVLLGLMVVGLASSLWSRGARQPGI